ncbi:hypothetical protein LX36DRAFT_656384 [Colletotrichum falcatum]|nr:hypothetical protein LX36DRAFT_656384 [Colletotrichum falcatum]
MARKRGTLGHKPEGAQAGTKADESKRGQEPKKDNSDNDVDVGVGVGVKADKSGGVGTKRTDNGGRCETIDDLFDYIEVKLEDLELDGRTDGIAAALKAEDDKGGAPLTDKKKRKKKRAKKAEGNSEAAQVKEESADAVKAAAPEVKEQKRAKVEEDFLAKWDKYFGKRELADWQRLCFDLCLPSDLPSKTQCRKALKTRFVNIRQFVKAVDEGDGIRHFADARELARFTRKRSLWVPINGLPKGDPLRTLLHRIKHV